MPRIRLATYCLVLTLIVTQVEAQAQRGLAMRVADLENEVATLIQSVQRLQDELARRSLCSDKLKFFSPSNPMADIDGCVSPLQVNTPFETTILATVESDVFVNPQELLVLSAVVGSPTHLRISTRCATLGNNGFSFASIVFLDSNADPILSLAGCVNHGVSNGESTGTGNDKIVPIPVGTAAVELRTRLLRTIGGQDHNNAVVTVDVLGNP